MKLLLLYFLCSLISGSLLLCASLPQSYFCFAALKRFSCAPHPDEDFIPTRDNLLRKKCEEYLFVLANVSCGFILSEITVVLMVLLSGDFSATSIFRGISLPIPLYALTAASTCAAVSHLRNCENEKARKLICALTPLLTVAVAIIVDRGGA